MSTAATKPHKRSGTPRNTLLIIVSLAAGVLLLLATLAASVAVPSSGESLAYVMRVLCAIGGMLAANGGIGTMSLKGTWTGLNVRATGSLAVLVLLLVFDLPNAVAEGQLDAKTKESRDAVATEEKALGAKDTVTLVDEKGTTQTVTGEAATEALLRHVAGSGSKYLARSAKPAQLVQIKLRLAEAARTGRVVLK